MPELNINVEKVLSDVQRMHSRTNSLVLLNQLTDSTLRRLSEDTVYISSRLEAARQFEVDVPGGRNKQNKDTDHVRRQSLLF